MFRPFHRCLWRRGTCPGLPARLRGDFTGFPHERAIAYPYAGAATAPGRELAATLGYSLLRASRTKRRSEAPRAVAG